MWRYRCEWMKHNLKRFYLHKILHSLLDLGPQTSIVKLQTRFYLMHKNSGPFFTCVYYINVCNITLCDMNSSHNYHENL